MSLPMPVRARQKRARLVSARSIRLSENGTFFPFGAGPFPASLGGSEAWREPPWGWPGSRESKRREQLLNEFVEPATQRARLLFGPPDRAGPTPASAPRPSRFEFFVRSARPPGFSRWTRGLERALLGLAGGTREPKRHFRTMLVEPASSSRRARLVSGRVTRRSGPASARATGGAPAVRLSDRSRASAATPHTACLRLPVQRGGEFSARIQYEPFGYPPGLGFLPCSR